MFIVCLLFVLLFFFFFLSCRVVADDQRSLALGLNSAVYRVFGTVPGPLIFGALFDASCLAWQDNCGRRGNCWVHDNDQLSVSVLAFSLPCLILSAILFLLALITYPKQQKDTTDESIDFESATTTTTTTTTSSITTRSPRKFRVPSLTSARRSSTPTSPRQHSSIPMSPRRRSSNYRTESTCSDDVLLNDEVGKDNAVIDEDDEDVVLQ